MSLARDWKEVLVTEAKFLCFFPVRPDLRRLGNHYLTLALGASWIAGLGRYWDHPNAEWWQYAGLGSVAYVFVLALVLWLLFYPLRSRNWSYRGVLTFVGMTSPPAILYAIPIERYVELEAAQSINVWFLVVVAAWRVALLVLYLRRAGGLEWNMVLTAAPLPLALIVSALALLNLEHVIFRVMAGLREGEHTPYDDAYGILVVLTLLSYTASPLLLGAYAIGVYNGWSRARQEKQAGNAPAEPVAEQPETPSN